jgi:2-polyprenyl-3-methyl-5-hydroxy-6-metoxy-1,4-benzoquinol methylase
MRPDPAPELGNAGRNCWCGGPKFLPVTEDYVECEHCRTALLRSELPSVWGDVKDVNSDFYSETYWFAYQEKLGHPSIIERARLDLSERCMYWLGYLLKFLTPPARVLEVGCAHGAFLFSCKTAGYEVLGIEMSPFVVNFAETTFGVQVLLGPVEQHGLPPASFDAVIMMDVLEHLSAPLTTMAHLHTLLKDDGICVIQTPHYEPGRPADWSQFKPLEHLYLFTKPSLTSLLKKVGFLNVRFLEPFNGETYDIYCVAGKGEVHELSNKEVEAALLKTPGGRLVLAMQDLYWRRPPVTPSTVREAWGQLLPSLKRSIACRWKNRWRNRK